MTIYKQELELLRSQIDDVDSDLLKTLRRRAEISTAISHLKLANGKAIIDPIRESEMVLVRASEGMSLGLPEAWVSDLFKAILKGCVEISCARLEASVNEKNSDSPSSLLSKGAM
ncbi:chorismate mutase [Polynucleobacter sp.]|jgi:chorismate mutase|uniref:chorismate mutase n=1 Tax=Polynucleobacter sp. TaxID=2029855 RepID=UPI0037C83E6D